MSLPLPLGQRVRWRRALIRGGVARELGDYRSPIRIAWHPVGEDWHEGIVVGWRTLSNGRREHYSGEPPTYFPERYYPAYLVAFDVRLNPVYVLPENVEPL